MAGRGQRGISAAEDLGLALVSRSRRHGRAGMIRDDLGSAGMELVSFKEGVQSEADEGD